MKTTPSKFLPATFLVFGLLVPLASAQLIDDFSTPGLGEYTLTRVLDNGFAEANISLSDSSGALVASYGGTISQPEQVVFLRSDFTLAIGNRLLVDVAFATQASQLDFGIAVANGTPPTAVTALDTDTRDTFKWAAVYVRPTQDAVRSLSYDTSLVSATGVLTAVETTVAQLFIERTSAVQFILGYYTTSAVRTESRTVDFTSASDVGSAIGFYGDLRATGGTLGSFDNFRTEIIPEPGSAVMLLGGLGMLGLVRRRNLRK